MIVLELVQLAWSKIHNITHQLALPRACFGTAPAAPPRSITPFRGVQVWVARQRLLRAFRWPVEPLCSRLKAIGASAPVEKQLRHLEIFFRQTGNAEG
jgi:hypothetical protein